MSTDPSGNILMDAADACVRHPSHFYSFTLRTELTSSANSYRRKTCDFPRDNGFPRRGPDYTPASVGFYCLLRRRLQAVYYVDPCLSVCWQDDSNSCGRIFMKFGEYVDYGPDESGQSL